MQILAFVNVGANETPVDLAGKINPSSQLRHHLIIVLSRILALFQVCDKIGEIMKIQTRLLYAGLTVDLPNTHSNAQDKSKYQPAALNQGPRRERGEAMAVKVLNFVKRKSIPCCCDGSPPDNEDRHRDVMASSIDHHEVSVARCRGYPSIHLGIPRPSVCANLSQLIDILTEQSESQIAEYHGNSCLSIASSSK